MVTPNLPETITRRRTTAFRARLSDCDRRMCWTICHHVNAATVAATVAIVAKDPTSACFSVHSNKGDQNMSHGSSTFAVQNQSSTLFIILPWSLAVTPALNHPRSTVSSVSAHD